MKLKGQELQRARHLLQHTIRIRNHAIENPDHYGAEHDASLTRYKAAWAALDAEQRADALAELKVQRALAVFNQTAYPGPITDEERPLVIAGIAQWIGSEPRDANPVLEVALERSGVADLHDDAIAAAVAYLESEG